jgi:CRP-like cAMP-binding protein
MTDEPEDDHTVTSHEGSTRRVPRARGSWDTKVGALASFSELSADLLLEIESAMTERRFEAGETLMRQGDPGDCLMVVQEGEVEVIVAHEGARHVLKRAGPGEVFGEMALLTREARTASVVALTPVRALVLSVEDFHRLARKEPALAEVLSHLTARRLGAETYDALSGKIFHGYTIRRRLGRGGMAVVYEAHESATGRRVALKMMSHRLAFRDKARQRFQQEADLIESFDHENIARMLGRFEAFHTFFIVMEYCDGSSLDRILKEHGPTAVADARRILGQLSSALAYAHERRIAHRDINPSNVMLNRDGVVKLMDFGLARPLEGSSDAEWEIEGTPPYLAPEQLRGQPSGIPADIYGLGGLAWAILTGASLFQGKSFKALAEEHRAWRIPSVSEALPGLDADLREFLTVSLARDPQKRSVNLRAIASWAGPVSYDDLLGPNERGLTP